MQRRISFYLLGLVVAGLGSTLAAQGPATDTTLLTVDRIFGTPEFRGGSLAQLAWLSDGVGYTSLERSAGGKPGQDIVRYDAETGLKTFLVPAARLVPPGDSTPLDIEEYSWSADGRRLLIFAKAQQHPRRLLGSRSRRVDAQEARRQRSRLDADVREVRARRRPRGVGPLRRVQPLCRGHRQRQDHAADARRLADHDQRHVRLGLRRRARAAGRLALEL